MGHPCSGPPICAFSATTWRVVNGSLYMDNCGADNFFDADPAKMKSEADAKWNSWFGSLQDGPFNYFAYHNASVSGSGFPGECAFGGGSPSNECIAAVKQACPSGTTDCAGCIQKHADSLQQGECHAFSGYSGFQLEGWFCGAGAETGESEVLVEASLQ